MGIFEFLLAIAIILLLLIVFVLLVTKKGRMFAKAAIGSFFTEANKNPKIVAEYFDEKIAKLQESYEKADNAYRIASGEKISNEKKIAESQKELNKLQKLIVKSKEHGDIESARMYADQAMAIESELQVRKENIPIFEEMMKSRGDIRDQAQEAIRKVQARKKADITKAEAGKAAQEIYSQFDESRVSSDIDRVLKQFSDYADDQEKMGLGAKASWDTSYEAKKISAEKRSRQYMADDYISSLVNGTVDDED